MKKKLTKWMIALVCVFGVSATAFADRDKPVNVSQLPAKAQQILKKKPKEHIVHLKKLEILLMQKMLFVIILGCQKKDKRDCPNMKQSMRIE